MAYNDTYKKLMEWRRRIGLCPLCGEEAIDSIYCPKHRADNVVRQRKYFAKRKALRETTGQCIRCPAMASPGVLYCERCRTRNGRKRD